MPVSITPHCSLPLYKVLWIQNLFACNFWGGHFLFIPRLRSTGSWDQCISGCLNPCMYVKLCSRGWLASSAPSRPLRKARCMLLRIRPQWMSASAFSSRGSTWLKRILALWGNNCLKSEIAWINQYFFFKRSVLLPRTVQDNLTLLQIIFVLIIYILNCFFFSSKII